MLPINIIGKPPRGFHMDQIIMALKKPQNKEQIKPQNKEQIKPQNKET